MQFLKAFLSSKKAGAMIFGIVVKVLVTAGLDPDLANAISDVVVQLVTVYIGGQSLVDLGLAIKGSKTT